MVYLVNSCFRSVVVQDITRLTRNAANTTRTYNIFARCMSQFSVTRSMLGVSEAEMRRDEAIIEPPALRVYHCKRDIRGMPRKMNSVAKQVRTLQIDEAIRQMKFSTKKAAETVKEALEEAQKLAVEKHGVQDQSNLFVEHSYVGRAHHIKQIKYHARGRFGIMQIHFCHYFLVLQEGPALGRNKKKQTRHLSDLQRFKKNTPRILHSLSSF